MLVGSDVLIIASFFLLVLNVWITIKYTYCTYCRCIKHLLLEGNKLTHLPAQMGMTKSLSG